MVKFLFQLDQLFHFILTRLGRARCSLAICSLVSIAMFIVFCTKKFQIRPMINSLEWNNEIEESLTGEPEQENGSTEGPEQNKTFKIRYKNIHMEYRMGFADPCPSSTKLLLLSMTRRDSFEKRKAIRKTWMAEALHIEVIRFLVADPIVGEKRIISAKLKEEQTKHGDLIFMKGFTDIYKHLHLKWYGGLQWQQTYCPSVEWVAKADDDTIVHLRRLEYWTEHKFRKMVAKTPLVYFGWMYHNDGPNRKKSARWYVSEAEYPGKKYPDYVHGPVYLTTPATISAVLAKTQQIDGFNMDDVIFTGILADMANVTRVNLRQHFTWHFKQYAKCENGVPAGISMWGMNKMKEFVEFYKRIKSVKCLKQK